MIVSHLSDLTLGNVQGTLGQVSHQYKEMFALLNSSGGGLTDNAPTSCASKKAKDDTSTANLTWEEKFAMLKDFKNSHGHCRVPPGYTRAGFNLGGWAATQRKEHAKLKLGLVSVILNDKRVMRLHRVGFDFHVVSRK